ncbi:DUF4013 domain-containing protein [Methanosphaerula subterraneus]|uniref:DUF4013 domain-containing protein n=1 Tax=Methanosphaerula subterraneus TaxID=3350244 RepID=UPI003F83399F
MDYGNMVLDAFEYTREALIEKWMRWLLLTIVTAIPIVNFISLGYMMEIIRGTRPAPELEDWGTLFVDGLKLFIVGLVYMIPAIVIFLIFSGLGILAIITSGSTNWDLGMILGLLASGISGLFIALIVGLVIGFIAIIGMVRFTRTGSLSEAFNFNAILETISRISWMDYIIALVILYIVSAIVKFVVMLLSTIPVLGWIIGFFITAALVIFEGRYLALIYDSA